MCNRSAVVLLWGEISEERAGVGLFSRQRSMGISWVASDEYACAYLWTQLHSSGPDEVQWVILLTSERRRSGRAARSGEI